MPMRLPGGDRLEVPDRKIIDYLLSTTHHAGRGKAAWFLARGFLQENWIGLSDAIRRHGSSHPISNREDTPFGTRYTVEGPLRCPDGGEPMFRSVWFIERNQDAPRFVTAYPLRRSIDDQGT